ncbi:efflux RND transporter periplasmic adaptor subunit [Roseivirga pacifica]|nr:efflux RND transporter periplasmic adaptor subunit [Roseivirga pacifica]
MKQRTTNNHNNMKVNSIIAIFLTSLVVLACGQSNDDSLEGKKASLAEAKKELKALEQKIGDLEKQIADEDPSFGKANVKSTLITTVPAAKTTFEHQIEVRGNVESRTNVFVSSEVMGQLIEVNVVEGQKVSKGQVIARVDSENLEKSIDEVKTQLSFATTIFEKRARLWEKNIGTEVEYLQAKNNKESLENQLSTLQTQLDKTQIRAPFTGSVEDVPVKEGEIVQPGSPVAFIVSNANMYITAEVSENYIGRFEVGDKVEVELPAMGETFTSTISSVGNVINAASRTFTVEVKLPQVAKYLKTNLVALVHMTDYRAEEAVVIPSRIIQEDFEGNYVFLLDNKKAKKVHVKLGQSFDNQTEVVAGLSGGESVIDKGNRAVADGTTVEVQN